MRPSTLIIAADGARGKGIGGALMTKVMAFCNDHGFDETRLWTFAGLNPARRLYGRHGFHLVEESPGDRWGTEVLEQIFVRVRGRQAS